MNRYILALLLCLAVPALAQEDGAALAAPEEEVYSSTLSVTSVNDCFAQFTPAEVVEMRRDYTYPYSECTARLAKKEEAARKKKEKAAQKEPSLEKDGVVDSPKEKKESP